MFMKRASSCWSTKMMIMLVSRTPIPRNDTHGIGVADRRGEVPVLEGAAEVMTN